MSGERRILMGRIVGAHGVQGWVRLESHTEPRENIFGYLPWVLRHRGSERSIGSVQGRTQGQRLVAQLPSCETRDQAEALVGAEIWIARATLPPPQADEYYWVDLEGLRVIDTDGVEFGRISHMLATGANDVMVVEGARECLIPFVQGDVVKRVDLDAGLVEVDWDPAL